MQPTYGRLRSEKGQNDKTLCGGKWIESELNTKSKKIKTQLFEDGEIRMDIYTNDNWTSSITISPLGVIKTF